MSRSSTAELDLISTLDPELFESAGREQLLSVLASVERTRNDWIRRAVLAGRDDILAQEVLGYTVVPRLHGRIIDHLRRHKRTLTVAYPGSGKALALDTPLPTPGGWTTMGNIQVGDALFDDNGHQCLVTFVTDVQYDRRCYEIEFSDGAKVVADADHLWLTSNCFARMEEDRPGSCMYDRPTDPAVRTTEEIGATLRIYDKNNHSVKVTRPLALRTVPLPIGPYTLGAWLGDGHSDGCAITCVDQDILDTIAAEGYELVRINLSRVGDAPRYTIVGLTTALRKLDVLKNKHIPSMYLRASIPQRRALLAGLMDTDGYASPDGREVEFCTIRRVLADQVFELAASLGFKPVLRTGRATLRGKDCGPKYRVLWCHRAPIFRMTRKANRRSTGKIQAGRAGRRYIVAVRPTPSVPVRCIQVDSPSRLYLCSRAMIPTHNTTVATVTKSVGSVLRNRDVRILIGSKSQENAVGMLQAIKGHLESNRRLIEIFGNLVGDRKWDATAIEVKGAHPARLEPTINTVGYKGSVASKHYDIIFADDLVDEENSKTQQSRDRMEDWFWKVLDTRLLPPDDRYPDRGQLHVLNTIFHWDDLPNRLMKKMPGTTLVIPVVDAKGVYAWPKVHTPAWVAEKLRFYGLLRFALQFKCTSELMKGTIFKYDDCQRISLSDYPKASEMRFYIGIDLAISQSKKADRFAIVCIGRPMRRPEQVYVWDAWEGHLPFTKQTEKIAAWCARYRPVRAVIETNQYQEAQYQVLREKHPEYNIQPHPTSKNKLLRAHRRTSLFEAGNAFFLQGAHQHLVDHLVLFKGDDTTPDDLFDAFDHAVLASEGCLQRKRREHEPGVI